MADPEPDHHAPEGASCAEHPDRPAVFTCTRCGNYACLFCFHASCALCEACLKRDPASAAPPIPWETSSGSGIYRYFATLATAFRPTATAPAFAQSETRSAWRFFLLSMLPIAALAGVIPNTKTLMFGGSLTVILQGKPTPTEIALDVALAMLMQMGAVALDLLALGVPYVSLARAYAPERRAAALRSVLYRAWLVPAATLFFFLAMWFLPASIAGSAAKQQVSPLLMVVLVGQFTLNFLLFVAMRATARLACGIGPAMSYVVVVVAFTVRFVVAALVDAFSKGLIGKH